MNRSKLLKQIIDKLKAKLPLTTRGDIQTMENSFKRLGDLDLAALANELGIDTTIDTEETHSVKIKVNGLEVK
jgi:hypothetical protein